MRLAHFIKHRRRAMLGRNFKLTADMMLYKLFKKCIVFITKEIIVSYSRTDKHFFNFWQFPYRSQYIEILAVVGFKLRAWRRSKALFTFAQSALKL